VTGPRYLLDTNTCIDIINRRPPQVFKHFEGLKLGEVAISRITGAELQYGVANNQHGFQRVPDLRLDNWIA
jgi:tRNA(fMet)-specific endonuclease VapC